MKLFSCVSLLSIMSMIQFQFTESSNKPMGCYCGKYGFFVPDVKMCVKNSYQFDIKLDIFGSTQNCVNETYTYFPGNHSIRLDSIVSNKDCLTQELHKYSVSPSEMKISYDNTENSIDLSLFSEDITMKIC